MTKPIRIGVQLWPGGAPDFHSWRDAVIHAEEIGTDVIFGYDHFHRPAHEGIVDGKPVLSVEQPDVNNFEGWTALASPEYDARIGAVVALAPAGSEPAPPGTIR